MSLNESDLVHVIPYVNKNFGNNMNISILPATTRFINDTERFDFLTIIKTILIVSSIPPWNSSNEDPMKSVFPSD